MEYENNNNYQGKQETSLLRLIFLVCASMFIGYLFGQATNITSPARYFTLAPKIEQFKSELINKENIQLLTSRVDSDNIQTHLKYLFKVTKFTISNIYNYLNLGS